MMELLQILIKSAIVDNVVFIQYLAICPFIGMTADTDKAFGMGVATSFVIILATAVTWPIYKFIMIPLGLEFLQTLFFILIIASLVQLVEFLHFINLWVFTLHLLQQTVLFWELQSTVLEKTTTTVKV